MPSPGTDARPASLSPYREPHLLVDGAPRPTEDGVQLQTANPSLPALFSKESHPKIGQGHWDRDTDSEEYEAPPSDWKLYVDITPQAFVSSCETSGKPQSPSSRHVDPVLELQKLKDLALAAKYPIEDFVEKPGQQRTVHH